LVLAGVVSCAGTTASAPVDVELKESSLIEGAWANPLDAVMYPDPVAAEAIDAAGEGVIARCMEERGFTYTEDVFPWDYNYEQAQYVYGVTDPDSAAVNGLRSAIWMDSVNAHVGADSPEPSEEYLDALYGGDEMVITDEETGVELARYAPSSCTGQALDQVTPDWARMDYLQQQAMDILVRVEDPTESSDMVKAGFKRWSACMAESGYQYADPWAPDEDFASEQPTAEEIRVAVASAECMHSSGLLRDWSRARAEETQRLLEESPGLVTEWLELQGRAATEAGV
jgi:hypothetical protein